MATFYINFLCSSRYILWRMTLYPMLVLLIFAAPFYTFYFIIKSLKLGMYAKIKKKYFFLICYFLYITVFTQRILRVILASLLWIGAMYLFWKLGDPFPILSARQGMCFDSILFGY